MSSDGERIPKPSKRRRLLLTDSDNSDESIIKTQTKRRVYRVVSDVESSDEDSDTPRPVIKRKNHKLLSENESSYGSSESDASDSNFIESDSSSDWESDWESTNEIEEVSTDAITPSPKAKVKKSLKHRKETQAASTSAAGFESDVSDGQSEKCPICLLSFRNQEIATPSSCEHSFCLECINEWSKNVNNCPVDRKTFTVIHVRSKLGGKIIRHVAVEIKQNLEDIIQEDPTYCEVCHECDREDRMLLCDGCDLGYHLECLNPPMIEIPMDEWFCPDCTQNSQNDAEAVDIDLDELPDLMEEARRLGLSYGRSRSGQHQQTDSPRIIPRTRQTERVRANIRAGRVLNRSRVNREREIRDHVSNFRRFDPDQPSTSSGIESIGENSRSRSPDINAPSTSSGRTTTTRRATTKRKLSRGTTKRKSKIRKAKPRKSAILREVRITEINNDGEEEEIVTYVKVAATSSRRKKKYRRRKKRKITRARTVSSVASANKTAKRRLATALKMNKPIRGVPLLVPTIKNVLPVSDRSELISSRYSAGISQVSLFGRNLGLDYSPPGSDDEFDGTVGHGPAIVARSRGPISTTRRRMALKGIANPTPRIEQTSSANLLDSIISSQELWHSKKSSGVTLRANGTLVLANNDAENSHSINNNESPIKKRIESDNQNKLPSNDQPLDLSNVNPNDITQAPMYNNSRGGGNRGNFRGGYRDNNRQSHGGQSYSGRDPYSGGGGRRSFGGSGARDRDFGPPANYSANFEHRAPGLFGTPPLRNRNPQQFRNERNRYSLPERPPFREEIERPPFPFPENFHRGPPPGIPPLIPPGPLRMPIGPNNQPVNLEEFPGSMPGLQSQGNFESQGTFESQSSEPSMNKPDEECDIYGDMEGPNKHAEGESQNENMNNSSTLLPPPEPPSGLLDFDENSKSEKDNDSDQELVIDDAPKDDTFKAGKNDDKYDPFNAEESDSNDSTAHKENADKVPSQMEPPPLEPPPSLENFSGLNILNTDDDFQEPIKSTIRLTAYDDDDDEDSQADCPNFSIYSSETMDVARNSEQELSSQIGPLEPPPLPPDIPDMPEDDDVIVGDVQACDLSDIPEPSTPYVEALQKERQTISKIPSKKISANDSRGKITFKINKFKLNSKFGSLYDEIDKDIENSIEQEKELEQNREVEEPENVDAEKKSDSNDVSDKEDVPKSSKADKRMRKRDKRKARRNSEDIDVDSSESTKDIEREEEQPDLPMDELPTQKLQTEDAQSQEFDTSELPTQKLDILELQSQKLDSSKDPVQEFDISELATQKLDSLDSNAQNLDISDLPTQRLDLEFDSSEQLAHKIDESELATQKLDVLEVVAQEVDAQEVDMSELSTQKLDALESSRNEPDISELQTQRLYSPEAGLPTLYSPDVPIPTLYSPEPEKTEDDGVKTPDVIREWGSKKSAEEEATISEQNEIAIPGDEPEEGIGEKENLDSTTRADRSPETVISIADTTQSSQNDDCEIVEARVDEDGESSSYIGKDKRLKIQTGEEQSEIFPQERVVDGEEDFPLEKEGHSSQREVPSQETWDSDGGYTPCKDELPLKERRKRTVSPFDESGLEPITPTKDRNDDLDRCRTPAAYAGLGTEAISETDEAMNFEDELTLLSLRKEKEMEEGEILEDGRLVRRGKSKDKDDEGKKKKKKDKKDKTKESEKNKENISSENLVSSWKKVSKSNKDRNYREKDRRSRSREKDKDKKKKKEALKKKEKRKELPRYDVRKIVAEKPRPRKDEYGRDIRDQSRSLTRSKSRSRSVSKPPRRSVSKARRSRSYSRMRSRSRSKRRSWSRDLQRDRASRGRTYSRGRSLSPRRRKSPRRRSISRKRRSRSLSRRRRSMSPRRRKRSHSRKRRSRTRTRSRERRKDKKKQQHKSRSRSRNRKRSRSKSAKRAASRSREKKHVKRKQVSRSRSLERSLSQERERNRNWEVVEKAISREQHFREREDRGESWSAQWTPSLSASRSKTPERGNELPSRGWSPAHGLDSVTVPPKNLTVILTNKEAIKKKKKEKKKERRKSKDEDKRKKTKRNRTPPPSKEVFASGDNILVSVCFNKENETSQMQVPELPETIPLMPPTKRRRREPLQLEAPKKTKKDKTKEKRAKSPKAKKDKKKKSKAAEIAASKKPVAVIDLDQSPFREQTPSPRDVIVLSDDDEKQAQNLIDMEPRQSSQTTPPRDQFVSQGPKTPPEPQVKFSISNKTSNLRPSMMNPLMEEEEEEEIDERVEEELEMRAQEELELRLKIGPNTPPEPPSSPPTSPDAYDPFDPTKSRSPTPVQSQEATPLNDERNQRTSPRKHDTADTPTASENQQQEQQASEKQTEKPKIISMVTLKRPSPKRDTSPANDSQADVAIVSESPTKSQQNQQNAQSTATPFPTINPVLATVAAAVQRNIFNANAPATAQRNLLQANRISPSNQIKQRPLERPQLPNLFANAVKTMPLLRTSKPAAKSNAISQNGTEAEMMNDMIDMSSPYSPGSSLSDGMFEPPSPYNSPPPVNSKFKGSKDSKKDTFDSLFGSSPAANRNSTKVKVKKDKRKKPMNPKVGVRMDENQLQILDDLPSSAVEMQVKDKFLKKLNRQERVVEEVKLVLKPHYTKKHVTKEEYKDIMRKAVPKICHNRSGEINPKKIGALIEAYVKKCRSNKKKTSSSATSKVIKPMKNLWS